MRPYIGITCSSEPDGTPVVRPWYVKAVHSAGGLPVPFPFATSQEEAEAWLDRVDGVLLTGSEDLDPSLWGEERHPTTDLMHPNRHASELHLCRAILARRASGDRAVPVLAVCGGMQTMNVAAGGSLHQHLPDLADRSIDHSDPELLSRHAVRSEPGSRLAACAGLRFDANTQHHQAVARIGEQLHATGWSDDGVVEALEGDAEPALVAVQWHPERMLEDEGQRRLFDALVAAAGETHSGGHRAGAPAVSHATADDEPGRAHTSEAGAA